MGCLHVSHEWKKPIILKFLFGFEFLGTVAALVFFGIADPDTYRTALWQVGSDAGYCSSPLQILYAYANYRPIPTTPLVWSSIPTSFNVVVSVFSMFVLLVKLVMFIMHMWWPLLSCVVNAIIVGLWSFSIYGQAGPDYSDAEHPMPVAWYIAKSCDVARASRNYGNCLQAKGAFATSCIMLFLFVANLGLGIWSCIPTAEERRLRREENEDIAAHMPAGLGVSPSSTMSLRKEKWEMQDVPKNRREEKQPFTPRTLAFNTLDRQLPLRAENERAARFA